MSAELTSVLGCSLILYISILIQARYLDKTAGYDYAFSNRDDESISFAPAYRRFANNVTNQVEGLAIFVPLILVVELTGQHSVTTEIGSWIYLASRFAFAICYIFGIRVIRSIIWLVGMAALGAISVSLISGAAQATFGS